MNRKILTLSIGCVLLAAPGSQSTSATDDLTSMKQRASLNYERHREAAIQVNELAGRIRSEADAQALVDGIADVLADANNVYWTVTAWQERGPMQAFVGSEPHLGTMARLDDWCDEATFTDWEQSSADLPDWQTSYGHLTADGQVADLTHPSDAHATRAFPAPVEAS